MFNKKLIKKIDKIQDQITTLQNNQTPTAKEIPYFYGYDNSLVSYGITPTIIIYETVYDVIKKQNEEIQKLKKIVAEVTDYVYQDQK